MGETAFLPRQELSDDFLRSQRVDSPVYTHPQLPGSSSWANKEAERKLIRTECSLGAQSATRVLSFHPCCRISLEVFIILPTFQMNMLRFRDMTSSAKHHTAQEGMSWYQNP